MRLPKRIFPVGASLLALLAGQASAEPALSISRSATPATSGGGLVVEDATVLPAGGLGWVWTLSAARDPVVVVDEIDRHRAGISRRIAADMGFGLGLGHGLEVFVRAPLIFDERSSDPSGAERRGIGVGDLALSTKLSLTRRLALAVTGNLPTAKGTPSGGLAVHPRAIGQVGSRRLSLSLTAGALFRDAATADVLLANALTAGVSLRVGVTSRLSSVFEVHGETSLSAPLARSSDTPIEGLGGLELDIGSGAVLRAAAGAGIVAGVGAPDVRALAGIAFRGKLTPRRAPSRIAAVYPRPVRAQVRLAVLQPPVALVPVPVPDAPAQPDTSTLGVIVTAGEIIPLDAVFFEPYRARLRASARGGLRAVARALRERPEIDAIRIDGHADERGSDYLNVKLSSKRALRVRAYLVKQGVARNRILVRAAGDREPWQDNATSDGRAKNRRVMFHIVVSEER